MGVLIIGAKTNRLDLLNTIAEMSFPATFTVKNESQIPILLHYQGVYLEPVYVADKNAADIVFENSETLRNLVENLCDLAIMRGKEKVASIALAGADNGASNSGDDALTQEDGSGAGVTDDAATDGTISAPAATEDAAPAATEEAAPATTTRKRTSTKKA